MALRGQDYPTTELLDFRYRERFRMTQKELEEEPVDVYELNLSIINLENKLDNERMRRLERERGREIRQRTN